MYIPSIQCKDAISTGSVTTVAPVAATVLYTAADYVFFGILLISLVLFLRYVNAVRKLLQLKKMAVLVQRGHQSIALLEDVKQPFSFLSTIYVNKAAFENNEISTKYADT